MIEERKIVGVSITDKVPINPDTLTEMTAEELDGKTFYFINKLRVHIFMHEVENLQTGTIHLTVNKFKVSPTSIDEKIPKTYEFEGVDLMDLKPADKELFYKYAKNIKESPLGNNFVDCVFNTEDIWLLTASICNYCSKEDKNGTGMKVTYEVRN